MDPLPEDAPFFVKDYYAYYKTPRGYHSRSLNSNGGWNKIGCMSFMNMPQLTYTHEIRNAVLIVHGDQDGAVPVEYGIRAAQRYRNSKLALIPGDGHCYELHLDQAVKAVRDWMQERV